MTRMMILGAVLAVLVGAPPDVAQAVPDESRPAASVTKDGERWTLEFTLDRDAPVWAFVHSAQMRDGHPQWRRQQWRVETPGVVLDRRGFRDVMRSRDGGPIPRVVRLALDPAPARVAASYDPALVFSDGSVAMFSEQFDVFPLPSVEAASALPDDLNGTDLGAEATNVTWRDTAGPVLFKGERRTIVTERDAETYVLFGQSAIAQHATMATVIDPAMPEWIQEEIQTYGSGVVAFYQRRLGARPDIRPTVMASWKGPTPRTTSMGGSVLPGLIAASFEGEDVVRPTDDLRAMVRWFIGHESAHFWLGHTVRYEFARDMWITEGGADLMAIRALKSADPAYDDRAELQREIDDCVALTKGRGVVTAGERGEHRAYYACGAVIALAGEAVQRRSGGGDVFDFLAPLIVGNPDGVLTRDEWLDHLTRISGDADLTRAIERLLDHGAADPGIAVGDILARAGVEYQWTEGRPTIP